MLYTQEQTANFAEQSFADLIVEEKENVLTITLNRPDKTQCLSHAFGK
ncbi:MAG: enoyl-CoA hydratase/isomerase family protein [Bacteroidetes bacterium]|nr:enoyl-CoA hydratase/isomerase family protein [Bacteroidota bacterium]